jgi:hypothetical protein
MGGKIRKRIGSTFFQLIRRQKVILNSIGLIGNQNPITSGQDDFEGCHSRLEITCKK